ncbi:MAG: hypothetical protein ACE5NN_07425 [Candidatus Bathyarchaeia archaeon]
MRPSPEEEWIREAYTVEIEISEDDEVLPAREWALSLIDGWLTVSPKPTSKAPAPKTPTVEDVTKAFPRDLAGMLYFEDAGQSILIKPRHYLGSENFAKIAAILRDQLGGEYISAGKESHFRINKTASKPEALPSRFEPIPQFDPQELLNHDWKGRKLDDGSYAKGTLSWGWDFADQFSADIIKTLEKGPQIVDRYEFSLDKERNLVHVRKT